MKKSTYWLGLLAALSLTSVQAANQEIRALFRPDPSQPNKNMFINTTPNSGYCATYPAQCAQQNMFSIQLPVRFESIRPVRVHEGIPLKVPANWRQVTVTNQQTQETESVEVRITGIGSQFILSDSVSNLTGEADIRVAHDKLWTRDGWLYAPSPCESSGAASFYNPTQYRFFWKTPAEANCTKVAAFTIPSIAFDTLDIAYELRTPNPLGMSSGIHTGSLTYTAGPGGDFSLGAYIQPNDSALTLDFVLDVQHILKVDVPPGGDKVTLEPTGGWQPWIDGGRKPGRIYRDQIFYLSASSKFRVTMQCRGASGSSRCIMDGGGDVTNVTTNITLPPGIRSSGGTVERLSLLNNLPSQVLQPTQYVDRQVGVLHFEIPSDAIDALLQPGKSASLSTDITIIWESEV